MISSSLGSAFDHWLIKRLRQEALVRREQRVGIDHPNVQPHLAIQVRDAIREGEASQDRGLIHTRHVG